MALRDPLEHVPGPPGRGPDQVLRAARQAGGELLPATPCPGHTSLFSLLRDGLLICWPCHALLRPCCGPAAAPAASPNASLLRPCCVPCCVPCCGPCCVPCGCSDLPPVRRMPHPAAAHYPPVDCAVQVGLLFLQIPTGRRPRPFSPPVRVLLPNHLHEKALTALCTRLGFVRECSPPNVRARSFSTLQARACVPAAPPPPPPPTHPKIPPSHHRIVGVAPRAGSKGTPARICYDRKLHRS